MKVLLKIIGTVFIFSYLLASISYANEENNINIENNISEEESFILSTVEVIDYETLKLYFSLELDKSEDAIMEFNIVNKNDSLDTFDVLGSVVDIEDPKSVHLLLDKELTVGSEYEIIVISLTSVDGLNIESGIDGIKYFIVNEIIIPVSEPEPTVEIEPIVELESINEDQDIELNSANDSGVAGVDIKDGDTNKNTLAVAKNTEALPETGAEHIILIILSIIIGVGLYLFRFKKVI